LHQTDCTSHIIALFSSICRSLAPPLFGASRFPYLHPLGCAAETRFLLAALSHSRLITACLPASRFWSSVPFFFRFPRTNQTAPLLQLAAYFPQTSTCDQRKWNLSLFTRLFLNPLAGPECRRRSTKRYRPSTLLELSDIGIVKAIHCRFSIEYLPVSGLSLSERLSWLFLFFLALLSARHRTRSLTDCGFGASRAHSVSCLVLTILALDP
jgi:hypothetical protein